jgi:pilus assembly protein CpaC
MSQTFWPRSGLRLVAVAVGLALAATAAGTASAQTRTVAVGDGKVASLKVSQGRSQSVQVTRPFVDIVVGDPDVADVMPLTDRSLYVLGKKLGTTNISLYDAARAMVGVIEIEIGYDTPKLSGDIAREVPRSGARVSTANGRTVLSGTVRDSSAAARVAGLAKQYGPEVVNNLQVGGSQQVMLEVRFVEASRTAGITRGSR